MKTSLKGKNTRSPQREGVISSQASQAEKIPPGRGAWVNLSRGLENLADHDDIVLPRDAPDFSEKKIF